MQVREFAVIFGLILATCSASHGAGPATRPAGPSRNTPAYIVPVVRQLGAADPIEVEAAVIKLSLVPADAFPVIEAAANNSLEPKAAGKLKVFIERQRPWQAPRLRIAKVREEQSAWNRTTALEAYEKAGSKDAKWDEAAREAIKAFFRTNSAANPAARKAAEQAIEAGCNDPFILYIEGRVLEEIGPRDLAAVDRFFQLASEGMAKSEYPAYRQIQCHLYAFRHRLDLLSSQLKPGEEINLKEWLNLNSLLEHAAGEWTDFLDDNPPPGIVLETANFAIQVVPEDLHKETYENIYKAWQKASPDNAQLLTFTGQFYVTYAWDARGSGLANTVSEQGWKGMRERLVVAADALTEAWEKDNTSAAAAVAMLTVELGQNQGRNRMELWYRRALEADPDNRSAISAKMNYLRPKWHGSQQDMLIFAHQLYETQNWHAGFPQQLAEVYDDLVSDMQDPQAFLAAPQVWQDIQAVYLPYLAAFPDKSVRSGYCFYACRCGHWDIAKQQFDILGDDADPARFGGEDAMKGYRAKAGEKRTSPGTP